jgi:succinate dehydrogenase/fumarate reductase flavoprotein subunit
MKQEMININGIDFSVITLDTAIIGSGCAGFNAADWLFDLGRRDIAILTEGVKMGTSRNTGSDKQTYYKLSLASDGEDSVAQMAQTLFNGQGVHGDNALTEAACSVKSFIKLANLGVPFPTNAYGEYVGYKTDHDPRQRATSAGPLTSKFMTECLERSVNRKAIPIMDGITVVQILTSGDKVEGLLCLDNNLLDTPCRGLCIIRTNHVILATGGPAGCYFTSVFPYSQTGMSGMALEAGVKAANLQEWQYGLASIKFRWNVSGTYQQVIPKYISVDEAGVEREFLLDYFDNPCEALDRVFLKGYQWPFDTSKANGSSIIDIIVHHEVFNLGRRVYMDFRTDPTGLENGFEGLGQEAYNYLEKSHALIKTPIARLNKMNPLAIDLYKQHNIDLFNEPLEVSVCAQHHNGGIAVDSNWQSSIKGLYAAGEVAGTFGVHRPGGSALNSTQVGSMRAAEHIAYNTKPEIEVTAEFVELVKGETEKLLNKFNEVLSRGSESSNIRQQRIEMQKKMSLAAAHIRDTEKIKQLSHELKEKLDGIYDNASVTAPRELPALMKNRDIFITQLAVLSSMLKSSLEVGSRGSALVLSEEGETISPKLESFKYVPMIKQEYNNVLTTVKTEDGFVSYFEPVREMPKSDDWFENVWREYRNRTSINQ